MTVAKLTRQERIFIAEYTEHGDLFHAAENAMYNRRTCENAAKIILGKPAVIYALAEYRAQMDIHPEHFPTEETDFINDYLSIEETSFVVSYIRKHDIKEACEDCNIKRVKGNQFFNDPRVRGAIDAQLEAQSDRLMLSSDRILSEIMKIAFFNIKCLYDEKGVPLPIQELDDRHSAAISEIHEDFQGVYKYKVIDKMKALLVLMDYKEMIGPNREGGKDPSEVTGKDISDVEMITKLMSVIKKGQQ